MLIKYNRSMLIKSETSDRQRIISLEGKHPENSPTYSWQAGGNLKREVLPSERKSSRFYCGHPRQPVKCLFTTLLFTTDVIGWLSETGASQILFI